MRKENEKFKEIYEGNKMNFSVKELNRNTNYEFRICSIYNDLISPWSQIYKIKTKNIDSVILKESNREKEFIEKLIEWTGYKEMELLFRGTRDGMTNTAFHNKCDNKGKTITLIKNEKGNIFGGYSSISLASLNDEYHSVLDSFLFTLTNIYNTQPTKFVSKNDQKEIKLHKGYGPAFGNGHDLGIYADILNKGGWANFSCYTYIDSLGKGYSIFTGNSNNITFKVKEIEVFKLFN